MAELGHGLSGVRLMHWCSMPQGKGQVPPLVQLFLCKTQHAAPWHVSLGGNIKERIRICLLVGAGGGGSRHECARERPGMAWRP